MKFGIRLEGVIKSDEERRLADGFQHLAFRHCVLGRLFLLNDRRLLQHFHGVERAVIVTAPFPHQEHFAVSCKNSRKKENKLKH